MNRYVLDASVIIKFLVGENQNTAEKFSRVLLAAKKQQAEIISQNLLYTEVANGLRFSLKDKEVALTAYRKFLKLPLKTVDLTKNQQETILSFSYDLGTTVYDTSYHILAKSHGAKFLTCDKAYFNKAKILGDIELWE